MLDYNLHDDDSITLFEIVCHIVGAIAAVAFMVIMFWLIVVAIGS